jgi:hypothetical protein
MNTKLLKSMLVISVMGVAGNAYATNYPLLLGNYLGAPTLNPGDTASLADVVGSGVSFNDNWYFDLSGTGAGGTVQNIPVTIGMTDILDITGLSGALYTANPTTGATIALVGTGTSFNLPSLASGAYDFVIGGTATGLSGGAYSGAVVASAVPLPAAAWLLLSGLVCVGVMARRPKVEKIDGAAA